MNPLTIELKKFALTRICMLRRLILPLSLILLLSGVHSSRAFSLLGPSAGYPGLPATFGDSWEIPAIGYNPLPNGITFFSGDANATGPKAIGEEYRRNTPIIYYSCDDPFLEYFGSNGVAAIEQAFVVLNNLTNVSQYSSDLSEYPLETRREN